MEQGGVPLQVEDIRLVPTWKRLSLLLHLASAGSATVHWAFRLQTNHRRLRLTHSWSKPNFNINQ